jgi:hypothetical protein
MSPSWGNKGLRVRRSFELDMGKKMNRLSQER